MAAARVTTALLLGLVACGCAGVTRYLGDRGGDLQDIVSLHAGYGGSLPVNIGVELTPFVPVGIGSCDAAASLGWVGRRFGVHAYRTLDFPFNLMILTRRDETSEPFERYYMGGLYYRGHHALDEAGTPLELHGWNARRYGRLGVHVGLIAVEAAADVEVIELLDFLLGIVGTDLCGDDRPPEPSAPSTQTQPYTWRVE